MVYLKEFNIVGVIKTEKCFIYHLLSIDNLRKGEGKEVGRIFAPLTEVHEIGEVIRCIVTAGNLELVKD